MTASLASGFVPLRLDKVGTELCQNGTQDAPRSTGAVIRRARCAALLLPCRADIPLCFIKSHKAHSAVGYALYARRMAPTHNNPCTRPWHAFCSVPLRTTGLRFEVKHTGRCQGINGAMKHKNSHLLVGYWSRLRNGRDVPDQTDIDPRQIKRLLSYTFILDCENPSRPVYRLAGTALCERFGFELKGTGFLAHWESQSGLSLAGLLNQALKLRQPVCLSSIAATADNGMVELETILTPVSFNGGEPKRFFGLVQMLSDPTPLLGRAIAYERLIASQLIQEDEPLPSYDQNIPPPPPPPPPSMMRSHPKAPYLRLVINQDHPNLSAFGTGDLLHKMFEAFSRLRGVANSQDIAKLS
jgi:hypothetical protein